MRESSTYQAVLEEGRVAGRQEGRQEGRIEGHTEGALAEARRLLLQLGTEMLGKPAAAIRKLIGAVTEVRQLEQWTLRIPKSTSWEELLARPHRGKNGQKRKI